MSALQRADISVGYCFYELTTKASFLDNLTQRAIRTSAHTFEFLL
jgi:hypothetical protein